MQATVLRKKRGDKSVEGVNPVDLGVSCSIIAHDIIHVSKPVFVVIFGSCSLYNTV